MQYLNMKKRDFAAIRLGYMATSVIWLRRPQLATEGVGRIDCFCAINTDSGVEALE